MANPLNLSKLTVSGPFWTADVSVIILDSPTQNLALRRLFVDQNPQRVAGLEHVLMPGTMIAICVADLVTIQPTTELGAASYVWKRDPKAKLPALSSFDDMKAAVHNGQLALLLLATDAEAWPDAAQGSLPACTCIAGDISLDTLKEQKKAISMLEQALGLLPPQPESIRAPGRISVHASGLSILGQLVLPWLPDSQSAITALFQLSKLIGPPGRSIDAFRLSIEQERLTQAERLALIDAAQSLSQAMNPAYPLNTLKLPHEAFDGLPQWVTLELVDPTVPPRLFRPIPTWGRLGALRFSAGELNVLLSDQQPYNVDRPPTSLARMIPYASIERSSDRKLHMLISSEEGAPQALAQADAVPDSLSYRYRQGSEESIQLKGISTSYRVIEVAEMLRASQAMLVPEWDQQSPAPLAEPLIWAFMPLADGWAQLPFLNLTEQIAIDAGIARLDGSIATDSATRREQASLLSMQGAVSWSNRLSDGSASRPEEHPWTVTLTEAAQLHGSWTLGQNAQGTYQIKEIDVFISEPDIRLNGMLWLSTGRPSIENALPDFDNWVSGLRSIALERVHTRQIQGQTVAADLFPSLFVCDLETLSLQRSPTQTEAQLGSWQFSYAMRNPQIALPTHNPGDSPVISSLATQLFGGQNTLTAVLPPNLLSQYEPLVWRRHAVLPMVQVLALTQTKQPPNAATASRQLAPFALPTQVMPDMPTPVPQGWKFGLNVSALAARSGASSWPLFLGNGSAASEWNQLADLPMAALSLPGLILDPSASVMASGLLPAQYRYDLPYTDEVQALAQLPKQVRKPAEVSPLPDDPKPEVPRPLQREDYAAHWRRLSEQASLAAADAVEAFTQQNGQLLLHHLIEPYSWPVDAQLQLDRYPGRLGLRNVGAAEDGIVLQGGMPAADATGQIIEQRSDAALMGISGRFGVQGQQLTLQSNGADAMQVHAGSMMAYHHSDGSLRDQRGLSRAATQQQASFLTTRLQLAQEDGSTDEIQLTSLLEVLDLSIGSTRSWQLWFRDLPLRAGMFSRAATRSALAQDVNDPEAQAREYNYLTGYEWRLCDPQAAQADRAMLALCGLEFYPLTCDRLSVANEQVTELAIIGRLQLPLPGPSVEWVGLNNVVRLIFTRQGSKLALTGINAAYPETAQTGEWPLTLLGGEPGNAPRLSWRDITYDSASQSLTLLDAAINFSLFDADWSLPISAGTARFSTDLPFLELNPELVVPSHALAPAACALYLSLNNPAAPAAHVHRLSLDLHVRLRSLALGTSNQTMGIRRAFSAIIRFTLHDQQTLSNPADTEPRAEILHAHLFDDINLINAQPDQSIHLKIVDRALHFVWQAAQAIPEHLALLPGMPLSTTALPGCAVLSFSTRPAEHMPEFVLSMAFLEVVLDSQWGSFLQQDQLLFSREHAAVFGSSAGTLNFSYAAHLLTDSALQSARSETELEWQENFLFNGFLELKNVISWPLGMRFDPATSSLSIPAAQPGQALGHGHTRHTIRILLNQHRPPDGSLRLSPDSTLLLEINPEQPWHFLAVVEHQLIDIQEHGSLTNPSRAVSGMDRRWTVNQEVRLMAPQVFQRFLQKIADPTLLSIDPVSGLAPLTDRGEGYLQAHMNVELSDALEKRSDSYLLVEASAPHWIRSTAIMAEQELHPTALQYLPGGSQHAVLSGPQDYAAAPPDDSWLLLSMPFLGRLQDASLDSQTTAPDQPLTADPVLMLQQRLGELADIPSMQPIRLLLALTNHSLNEAAQISLSHLETAAGRSWARLDPLSLDEGWFRLHTPLPEPQAERLASISASLPDTAARASRSIALQRAFDVFRPYVPAQDMRYQLLPDARSYQLPDEIQGQDMLWRERSLFAPTASVLQPGSPQSYLAVTHDLELLYTFSEGSGATIAESSGQDKQRFLQIDDPQAVTWLADGGLNIRRPTLIRTTKPIVKLVTDCRQSNAITIEVWLRPAQQEAVGGNPIQHIVTLSDEAHKRNFTVQQHASSYAVHIRSSATDREGTAVLTTASGSAQQRLTHLVFTRSSTGEQRLYIDGRLSTQAWENPVGNLKNWDKTYRLAVASEVDGSLAWRGALFLVASYSTALTEQEVRANYAAFSSRFIRGWYTTGALLASSSLLSTAANGRTIIRRAAATLLPARLRVSRTEAETPHDYANAQPLAFAISPYLSLSFRARPAALDFVTTAVELICAEPITAALRPVANRFFPSDDGSTAEERAAAIQDWAYEQHRLLSPESRIAILRLRDIFRRQESAEDSSEALLVTGYRFMLVDKLSNAVWKHKGLWHLRTALAQLHFREGQYGGTQMPVELQAFELAPPQVQGVQALVLADRPEPVPLPLTPIEGETPTAALPCWPWGMSAMRYSVRYTERSRGIVGLAGSADSESMAAGSLWWQSFQHHLQYRSGLHNTAAAGLPPQFRAPQIRSLLPVIPDLPLPALDLQAQLQAESEALPAYHYWQSILPGSLRYLVLGARAGVMMASRAMIISQREQPRPAHLSGSVPIQHRSPRPAVLPPNDARRKEYALHTWASFFEAERNILLSSQPVDEAFYASSKEQSARRLAIKLCNLRYGLLPANWDDWQGHFLLELCKDNSPLSISNLKLRLLVGKQDFPFQARPADQPLLTIEHIGDQEGQINLLALRAELERSGIQLASGATPTQQDQDPIWHINTANGATLRLQYQNDRWDCYDANFEQESVGHYLSYELDSTLAPEALQRELAALGSGGELQLQIELRPHEQNGEPDPTWTFKQTLTLTLRMADRIAELLPLRPSFIHFEDPEYNRALATQAGRSEKFLKFQKVSKNEFGLFNLVLATDRRSYNPTSPLALIFSMEAANAQLPAFTVSFERIMKDGITQGLILDNDQESISLRNERLFQLNLGDLHVRNQIATLLEPDDKLVIALYAPGGSWGEYGLPAPQEKLAQILVDIVAEPVNPTPTAAYALLRNQHLNGQEQVECVRFAWGPDTSRIDLVAKEDLLAGVVRRRAVFQWSDTARLGMLIGYAIQKITASGSSHIPTTWERVDK